ncbi:hypothetical protein NLM33_15520 [Bradyrhizobium sp. CCGUVB1N3]|uniref:DUF6894 family protein n=1 Tax=Bradyrhizobium sp. CCGUVB1N3 TaxID=2949629 RepID=UPI0020B17B40|nr:hypothetical protein [Bradyrhizobium sp. CCGUVB1N3]MCP3471731.1 hypothetical protein [Bradyrhizobium sp. CCGUVB1N3]
MSCYYFDLRDDDDFAPDDEGLELPNIQAVQEEAAKALTDAARDALLRPINPTRIAVEARDDSGPVMQIRFTIEVEINRKN